MTGRIHSLLLLTTFAAVLCGTVFSATARAGAVRIQGEGKASLKQAEIDKLIEFYQWAFEARFTPGERERFAQLSAEYYRQNPEGARKDAAALIAVYAKVRAKDDTAQRELRRAFNESFVKELRAAGGDVAQLLLSIYERGQGGETAVDVLSSGEDLRDAEPSTPSGGSREGAPNSLVGRWLKSGGSGGSRSPTGKTLYNSGNDVIFEFHADGTMLFVNEKNTLSITQCRITETMRMPGTYSVDGDSLTLSLGAGTHIGTSSCERAGNFKRTLSSSSLTKRFVVKRMESIFRPDAPLLLCLDGAKDDDCFERADK